MSLQTAKGRFLDSVENFKFDKSRVLLLVGVVFKQADRFLSKQLEKIRLISKFKYSCYEAKSQHRFKLNLKPNQVKGNDPEKRLIGFCQLHFGWFLKTTRQIFNLRSGKP